MARTERNIRLDWSEFVLEAVNRRKIQGFTQTQFAILAGVSKPTLSKFEQGKTTISLDNAFKILRLVGLVS